MSCSRPTAAGASVKAAVAIRFGERVSWAVSMRAQPLSFDSRDGGPSIWGGRVARPGSFAYQMGPHMREIELYMLGFACNAVRPSGSSTAMRRLSLGRHAGESTISPSAAPVFDPLRAAFGAAIGRLDFAPRASLEDLNLQSHCTGGFR